MAPSLCLGPTHSGLQASLIITAQLPFAVLFLPSSPLCSLLVELHIDSPIAGMRITVSQTGKERVDDLAEVKG